MMTVAEDLERRIDEGDYSAESELVAPPKQDAFKEIVRKFVARLGDAREWTFDGEIIDLGVPSGKCTCDHPIRYVFIIRHPDGRTAPVGSECINHFQAYNPDLWEKMKNAHTEFWEKRKAAEKAAKEAQAAAAAAEAKKPWDVVRAEARKLVDAYKETHKGTWWLPHELYTLQCMLTAKDPGYKRTKTYVDFYKRETKQMAQLIYRHLNAQIGTPAHLRGF